MWKFEKRVKTPISDELGYTGIEFSLYAEAEDADFPHDPIEICATFDDEQAEAERYVMQEGAHNLWRYADVYDQTPICNSDFWDYVHDDER